METYKKVKKNLIFRTLCNNKSGLGHLIRNIHLANKLKKYNVYFVLDSLPENKQIKKIIKKFNVINLYKKNELFNSEKNDLKLFLEKVTSIKIHTIIVDHYFLTDKWHKKAKNICKKLILIDDLNNRKLFCDYYINYKAVDSQDYIKKAKKNCNKNGKLLLGKDYCILNPNLKIKRSPKKLSIMLNFGNSFDFSISKKFILSLVKQKILRKTNIFICIGVQSINYKYLMSIKSRHKNIKLIYKKIFIENYFKKINLFIGSSGHAIYEMSYLGIPSVFISFEKNQLNPIKSMERLGHYFFLRKEDLITDNLTSLINLIFYNYKRFKNYRIYKETFLKKNGLNMIVNKTKL